MEPDDPLGDDHDPRPLLPPDDRLWRHPSEVAAFGLPLDPPAARRRAPRLWAVALLAGATGAVLAVGLVAVAGGLDWRVRTVPVIERVALPAGSLSTAAGATPTGVTAIVDRLRPAIVDLVAEVGAERRRGSGVLFRSDGHVLTNSHVVDGASRITVTMSDGATAGARLVGADPGTDLAVVKVDAWASLPTAPLGATTVLAVGQDVMAVGATSAGAVAAPFAVGMVRALGRQLHRDPAPALADMIQTDTPIDPAWSGGALVDDRGAVVGIVTALTLPDAGPAPSGFATPIELARSVAEQLVTSGRVAAAWLGIEGGDLDPSTAATMGMEGGAVVSDVRDDSPAARAGLAPADVITSVDGVPVASMGALRVVLRSHRPGEVVRLAVARQAALRTVEITLAERPPG